MNFVKKLFHNQQQQQQQRRVSNSHRHAAAAGSTTTAITSSAGSTSTNTSASIPLAAAAAGTAGTDAATVKFSASGQEQLHLVNKHHKKTKHSRRQLPQRLRRTADEGNNDVQDDNAVDASHEPEKNGNAWKLSPFSSPGNSPSRRQDRTGNSTGGRQVLRLDTDTTDTESASVGGGSRAGTPTSTGRITTSKTTATTPGSSRSGIVLESATTPTDVVTREIKMASCRHVALVLPNLLLGSQEIANDLRGLRHYNVTHVLNVTVEVPDRFPDKFVYKRIAISDMPSAKLVPHFDDAFRFIDMARSIPGDGCVLVHCYYGNSRSASFVIGYLMVAERMRYVDALRYLQLLRPGVRPNDGFQRQLKHYETTAVKSLRQQSAVAAAAAAAIASDAAAAATTARQTASSGGT